MLPPDETIEWLWPALDWALEEVLEPDALFSRTEWLTPTWECFPVDRALEGDALVKDYFGFVQEHAGTSEADWRFELVAREPASPAKILEGMPHHMTGPVRGGGLVSAPGGGLPIHYAPGLERDPEMLVAVLSRSVAHWVCAPASEPPGGAECFDYAVDLVWVLLGFGVFACNVSFRTKSYESGGMVGWSQQRFGALDQASLTYCVALHAELLGLDPSEVREHLNPNSRSWIVSARKDLLRSHRHRLDALRARRHVLGPYRH